MVAVDAVVVRGVEVDDGGPDVVEVVGRVVEDGGTRVVDVVVVRGAVVRGGEVGRGRTVGRVLGRVVVGTSTGTTLRVAGAAAGLTST